MPKDTPLKLEILNGELVIRIGVETLAWAADHQDEWRPYDPEKNEYVQKWRVADPTEFAKDVVGALLREEEDGSSPISDLLDKMSMDALDDGSTAVDHLWDHEAEEEF